MHSDNIQLIFKGFCGIFHCQMFMFYFFIIVNEIERFSINPLLNKEIIFCAFLTHEKTVFIFLAAQSPCRTKTWRMQPESLRPSLETGRPTMGSADQCETATPLWRWVIMIYNIQPLWQLYDLQCRLGNHRLDCSGLLSNLGWANGILG